MDSSRLTKNLRITNQKDEEMFDDRKYNCRIDEQANKNLS
jgi:hypothetical protein